MATQRIQQALENIETRHDVRILFACESGSRAWGFPSADSDYDVRFIYLRPKSWYLSISLEHRRDVIELPISDDLDICGWDLRKALKLFYKSNPPLLEWLDSPIIYWEDFSVARQMRDLRKIYANPVSAAYHYLHMARGNYREYLKGERVRLKKYFYVLRPLLAIRWLERDLGTVPVKFETLVSNTVDSEVLKARIAELMELKKAGAELDYGAPVPELDEFIRDEIARLPQDIHDIKGKKEPSDALDRLFCSALDEVWG